MLSQILLNFEAHRHRTAVNTSAGSITYGELGAQVSRIAGHLSRHRNRPVAIAVGHGIRSYAAVLGTLFSGNTFVPIRVNDPEWRSNRILKASGAVELLLPEGPLAWKPELKTTAYEELLAARPTTLATHDGQTAYILFTSGSTGTAKGVVVPVRALEAFLDSFFSLGLRLASEDGFLQMFELTFDASLLGILAPLILGATCYPVDEGSSKLVSIQRILSEEKVGFALITPSTARGIEPFLDRLRFPWLKYCAFGGEALRESEVLSWKRHCPTTEFWNLYGPTEASIACSAFRIEPLKAHDGVVSIGRAMKNARLGIVDGELFVSGPHVANGYLDRPETDLCFSTDPTGTRRYRTGDRVFCDAEGDYFFMGRVDHQVKVNGYRVELEEIQSISSQLAGAASVALLISNQSGDEICLFIEGTELRPGELRQQLKGYLPDYSVPRKVIFVEKFPLLSNDKIDREQLRNLITGERARGL